MVSLFPVFVISSPLAAASARQFILSMVSVMVVAIWTMFTFTMVSVSTGRVLANAPRRQVLVDFLFRQAEWPWRTVVLWDQVKEQMLSWILIPSHNWIFIHFFLHLFYNGPWCKCDHVQPLLQALHWLPVQAITDYKLFTICHNFLPLLTCLSLWPHCVHPFLFSAAFSADIQPLHMPHVWAKTISQCSFSCRVPKQWNSLLSHSITTCLQNSPLQTI